MKTKKQLFFASLAVVMLIVLDQLTKIWATIGLKGKADFVLIKNVFVLHYLENDSAAFSFDPVTLFNKLFHPAFFQNDYVFLKTKMIFFVILTLVVLYFLARIYRKIPVTHRFIPLNIVCILVFAGAIGNCIDRIIHNYVVDFFYFELINFPIFNVADIYVTCACATFVIILIFVYKDSDLEKIFPKKSKQKKEENLEANQDSNTEDNREDK